MNRRVFHYKQEAEREAVEGEMVGVGWRGFHIVYRCTKSGLNFVYHYG